MSDVTWEVEITRDGTWPTSWRWRVARIQHDPVYDYDARFGETFTKDRARRKAVRAQRSMERDDVKLSYPA